MALSPSLVDIFLSSLSQVQSQRSGPLGRLLTAKNVVVRQYDPGAQPQRIALKQRNGFTARTTELRLASDGTNETPQWNNPELLTSLDEQLVSICNSRPRVWNGSTWSYYPDTRAVTNKLTQRILHTSNHTVQAPTSQTINGVTCDVWTETTIVNSLPVTGAYISISAPNGAWVRTPQLLYQDASGRRTLAKVVADPFFQQFWVFFNKIGLGGEKIAVHLYDLNGESIATPLEIDRNDTFTPGYWDATFLPSGLVNYSINPGDASVYAGGGNWIFPEAAFLPSTGAGQMVISGDPTSYLNGVYTMFDGATPTNVETVEDPGSPHYVDASASVTVSYFAQQRIVLIQPTDGTGVTDGVDFSTFTYDGVSTITENRVTDLSVHTCGPVSWVTNDLGDALGYFATVDSGEGDLVWAYQSTGNGQTHEYNLSVSVNDFHFVDSLIGWTEEGASPHQPTINVGITYLSDGSSSDAGPIYDPAYRRCNVYACDFANTVVAGKQLNSVVPVSRAFRHNNEYHAFTYYQSGSGLTVTPDSQTVTIDNLLDYMTGTQSQALTPQAGDHVSGIAGTTPGVGVLPTAALASQSITATDKVELHVVTAGDDLNGVWQMPIGSKVLKWTFANAPGAGYGLSDLVVTGCSEPTANGTWDLLPSTTSVHVMYTRIANSVGIGINFGTGTSVTFTATGNVAVVANALYTIPALESILPDPSQPNQANVLGLYGHLTWSGDLTSANNGTFTIKRFCLPNAGDPNSGYYGTPIEPPGILVTWTAQVITLATNRNQTAVVTPQLPKTWVFASASSDFDGSDIGCDLVVASTDPNVPSTDVGTFGITSVVAVNAITTSAAAALASYYFDPLKTTMSVELPDTIVPYTFSFNNITVDFSYQDATIIVEGSPFAVNNTQYQVYDVNVAENLLYAKPLNGETNQRNQLFATGVETVTIIKANAVVAPWQPTFFMTPLTGDQPMVGKFDTGLAYADWRLEGDSVLGPNEFPLSLASVNVTNEGLQIALPYRAQNVTSNLPVATVRGQINLAGASIIANTVGLKTWKLSNATGTPALNSGELLLPGPMAGEFTLSGFAEDGINLGFEQPYLRSQDTAASGQLALTENATYQYVVVGEFTDENGNRIFTPPSPVLNVHLASGKNVITLQGRAMNPIASDGTLIPGEVGTSCRFVGISIYRTAVEGTGDNAQTTVVRYKVTNDLAINGLAPTSSLNASGFSFPDDMTWQYVDQNPDITVLGAEQVYTDKGYLPRYPAPAFTFGIGSWKNRTWVIASDGSIWMSGEKTEGDAVWFNPALRYVLPTDDRPVSMGVLEDNLIVFCEGGSVWQIPAAVFPDATGRNGTLPTPIQLPFSVVCTGHAVSLKSAVAFSSDARGSSVWAITRDLKLVWLSQPIQDALTASITGLTVDADQRLHVATGSDQWFVYDQVVDVWTQYQLPTVALLATTTDGLVAFQDGSRVYVYDPTTWADFDGTTHFGCPPDVTLGSVNFGTVRGLKSVWELQLVGTYKGPHRLNIELSYPDEYEEPTTTFDPVTPDPAAPYIVPFNPMVEEAASYGVRFYADFVGVESPGDSFEVELLTAEVGIDRKTGATKLPDSQTAVASDE